MSDSSREWILERIRRANAARDADPPMPDLSVLEQNDGPAQEREASFVTAVQAAGGRTAVLEAGASLGELVHDAFPEARRIVSALPGVEGAQPAGPCDPRSLDGTDVAVVGGRFGVAENGAVWVEQDVPERALYFIAEALVLVLPRKALVADMSAAYARLGTQPSAPYGVFVSGPSKTADIEQALVFGAHGPRAVLVVLQEDA